MLILTFGGQYMQGERKRGPYFIRPSVDLGGFKIKYEELSFNV